MKGKNDSHIVSGAVDAPRRGRRRLLVFLASAAAVLLLPEAVYRVVQCVGARRVVMRIDDLPPHDAGVVLGCSPTIRGRASLYFAERVRAAAALYHAGKVKRLLLSGATEPPYYDEPAAMRNALLALGVPDDRMMLDPLGSRTLDSIERARTVFGIRDPVYITQRFHAARTAFLVQTLRRTPPSDPGGVVYACGDAFSDYDAARERLACGKAMLDVVLGTRARSLDPPPFFASSNALGNATLEPCPPKKNNSGP